MRAPMAIPRTMLAILAVTGVLLLVAARSMFVVRVDQFAIITQFGRPESTMTEPGLYFRIPFVQEVRYLDRRILEWEDNPQEMITHDKKRIFINTFARWRIKDPLTYYTVVKTEDVAQLNLDKILGRTVRDVVSAHNLDDVVRDTNRQLTYHSESPRQEKGKVDIAVDGGRTRLMEKVFAKSITPLEEQYGIELIDIQMKQLNYTESARRETINEMISERMVVVERYEAEGIEESEMIHGEIEETIQNLEADANAARLILEGEGQAQAIATKSAAFAQDPELFQFLETLRLYEQALDSRTTLLMTTESPLFRLLSEPTASVSVDGLGKGAGK